VSLLDLLTLRDIREITDRTIQSQSYGRENIFPPPSHSDRLGGKLLRSLCSHLLLEPSNRSEIRTEISEYLPKTRLG